jgi:hypothetical protein
MRAVLAEMQMESNRPFKNIEVKGASTTGANVGNCTAKF